MSVEGIDYEEVARLFRTVKPSYVPPGRVRIVRGAELARLLRRSRPVLYASRDSADFVGIPSHVYYRAYKLEGDGYAVFYLFEWPSQTIPPHKYDYEPVIVLTDSEGNPREVYTDMFHYFIGRKRVNGGYVLYTETPWRSMEARTAVSPGWVKVYEPGVVGPQLEYLSDRKLAELKGRDVNPLKVNDKLVRDPFSVVEAEHWETYHTPSLREFLQDLAANYRFLGVKRFTYELYALLVKTGELLKGVVSRVLSLSQVKGKSHRLETVGGYGL